MTRNNSTNPRVANTDPRRTERSDVDIGYQDHSVPKQLIEEDYIRRKMMRFKQ